MADAGHALALKGAGGAQQRAGGSKDHALPFARAQALQEIAVEHRGGAAAAGAAGVHVLLCPVIQQDAAVGAVVPQRHAVPAEQLHQKIVAQIAQIAGDDEVVVPGRGAGVPEQGGQGVVGGGSHGRAHVGRVRNAQIHDAAPGGVGDIRALGLGAYHAAAGGGGRPLGRGRPLAAVGHRGAVLPLGGAEVGGGLGGGDAGEAAGHRHGRQRQTLAHGGAGAVYPVKRDGEVPQGEGGPDVLVQQVAGKDAVHVPRRQAAFLQGAAQGHGLHLRFPLLPCLLAEEGVIVRDVEIRAQRALTLQPSGHAGPAHHAGRLEEPAGLAAQSFDVHSVPPHACRFALSLRGKRKNMKKDARRGVPGVRYGLTRIPAAPAAYTRRCPPEWTAACCASTGGARR